MTSPLSLLFVRAIALWCLIFLSSTAYCNSPPNFLIIVADDMGWSDIGYFGSEINTPSLNQLAKHGTSFNNFYVAPTCSPTRSMLMTGVDHHSAGLATMDLLQTPNQIGRNYDAQLHDGVATVAEVLSDAGYLTLMSGKWHLAKALNQAPHQRGFEKSFALLEGGASHFSDRLPLHDNYSTTYLRNGQPVDLPNDFYSSINYTDEILEALSDNTEQRPFFAYLAFTAPHDPLQVPDIWLDRYRGRYRDGPEAIYQSRVQKLQQMGIIPASLSHWKVPQLPSWLDGSHTPWHQRSHSQQLRDARPMEIYAAMIELMDQQIGRLIDHLDQTGQIDNTYILFLSDNGANAATPLIYPTTSRQWLHSQRNNQDDNLGRAGSHLHLGAEWARVAGAPNRLFKGAVAEGGIKSMLLVQGPDILPSRQFTQLAHVTDIAPTLYHWAGIDIHDHRTFEKRLKPSGVSLVRSLTSSAQNTQLEERSLGFELFGNQAIRFQHWKLSRIVPPMGNGAWQLFNLQSDPAETQNLAREFPQITAKLKVQYNDYHSRHNIIAPEPAIQPSIAGLYTGPCNWWCSFKFSLVDQYIKLSSHNK